MKHAGTRSAQDSGCLAVVLVVLAGVGWGLSLCLYVYLSTCASPYLCIW